MLSAPSPTSSTEAICRPWSAYGRKAQKYSRSTAFFGLIGLLSLLLLLPSMPRHRTISLPAFNQRMVMVMEHLPPLQEVKAEKEKILAENSEVIIPEEKKVEEPSPQVQPEPLPTPPVKEKPVKTTPKKKIRKAPAVQNAAPEKKAEEPSLSSLGQHEASAVSSHAAEASPKRESSVLAAIAQAMEKHKRYPRAGRRSGAEGTCMLKVSIGPEGTVTACTLHAKSGSTVLDAAAANLGKKLLGLYVGSPGRLEVLVPVHYHLTDK